MVVVGVVEVDEFEVFVFGSSVFSVGDLLVFCEELMELLVVLEEVGGLGAGELVDGFGDFGFGDFGVDGFEGGLEALLQEGVLIGLSFPTGGVGGEFGGVEGFVVELGEPLEGCFFDG